ncbi:MAG: DUF4347 domain-containing protein [Cyanobacteria bacterium P01_E01_bin.35]
MNKAINYRGNSYLKKHRTITFIDAEVIENTKNYVSGIVQGTELIVIDSTRDGIEQITEILAARQNIKSLQIIASVTGKEGSLKIGSTQLDIDTLEAYVNDLQQWRNALSTTSEILIYGCLVVVESIFQNFIYQLAKITGADIGAFVTFSDSQMAKGEESDRYSLMVAWHS